MKNLFNKLKVFCALMLISAGVFAQQSLVNSLNITSANLNSSQRTIFQVLQESGIYVPEATQFLSIGNLAESSATGRIKLALPGNPCGSEFIYNGKTSEYNSESSYSWHGEMAGGESTCSNGELTIVSEDGVKAGHFSTGDSHYELQDLTGGIIALMKVDPAKLSSNDCGVTDATPSGNESGGSAFSPDAVYTSKVLVLYTAKAKAATPNISAQIALAISQFNSTTSNSAVSGCKLALAGSQQITFNETSSISTDVNTLATSATCQALRNQYSADIVILLTKGDYPGIAGIVKAIGPSNSNAYAIVETLYATTNYTFTHESGHLFGCRHNTDTTPGFAHGHFFNVGSSLKKTMMTTANTPTGGTRILYFSNPNVKYSNIPTGVINTRDNAKKLTQTASVVSAFR